MSQPTLHRRSCLEAWQEIDLQNLQLSLDEQASKLADFREACQTSRRALAASTKAFKKLPGVRDATEQSIVRAKLPKLLREYQEEVDRLTQRAKFSENCFLVIYRLIREAPDPGKELSDAERRVFEAETKLSKYLAEEGGIKRQNAELEEELKQKQKELELLQREQQEKENLDFDFEIELEKRIEKIKQNYKDELLDVRAKSEEDCANVSMQLELVQDELDKQNALVEQLKEELVQAQEYSQNNSVSESNEMAATEKMTTELSLLKAKLIEYKKEISVLKAENNALSSTCITVKEDYEGQIEELNYLVKDRTEIIREMQKNLSSRPTVEEHQTLRRQLLVMQSVLYNGTENESEYLGNVKENKEEDGENGLDGLESWLLKSNKDLKVQLVEARKLIDEQTEELARLKETEIRLGEALQDQSELARKLESDLTIAGNAAAGQVSSNVGSHSQEQTSASAASTPSGKELQESQAQRAVKSMLDAVCAQRDRLRTAVHERDERIEELGKQARVLREKQTKVEEDNMQLYQRIRFLQNYKQSERSTLLAEGIPTGDSMLEAGLGVTKGISPDNRPAASKGLGRGVEHRYRKIYESIDENPWSVFKNQEKERLFHGMPAIERITTTAYNAFLTRPKGRTFLAFYTILNHVLLLLLVYLVVFSACGSGVTNSGTT